MSTISQDEGTTTNLQVRMATTVQAQCAARVSVSSWAVCSGSHKHGAAHVDRVERRTRNATKHGRLPRPMSLPTNSQKWSKPLT